MTTVQSTVAGATTWELDPAHTHVEFAVKHMMISTVKGKVAEVSGTITLDETAPEKSSVQATLGAASIDTRVAQRDTHLRSADFLDTEHYPVITFRSTRVEAQGRGKARVTGDLTIRGVTHPIALEVTEEGRGKDPWGGERVGFSATGKFDRREFGLNWNQALEAGGVLVGNEVRITIEAEAVRQG